MPSDPNIEVVIQPSRSFWNVRAHEFFAYKDLLYFLVRRDFIAKYKQTALGPLWFVLQPLVMTVVFTVIFGRLTKIPTDGVPAPLFYLSGLLAWNYFSQSLGAVSVSLSANAHLLGKVYFPRLIVPLATVISNAFAFAIQFLTFAALYLYVKGFTAAGQTLHTSALLWFLPLLALQTALLSLGIGLAIAAVTVKYRDFHHLTAFLTQLWMYATPLIYPASLISPRWRLLFACNPMTSVLECYRYAFFSTGVVEPLYITLSVLVSALCAAVGLFLFNRAERTFVDFI